MNKQFFVLMIAACLAVVNISANANDQRFGFGFNLNPELDNRATAKLTWKFGKPKYGHSQQQPAVANVMRAAESESKGNNKVAAIILGVVVTIVLIDALTDDCHRHPSHNNSGAHTTTECDHDH